MDTELTKNSIKELLIEVQRIKSTGDGQVADELLNKYGRQLYKPNYVELLQNNQSAIMGDVLAQIVVFPIYSLTDENQVVLDIPTDILDFIKKLKYLE